MIRALQGAWVLATPWAFEDLKASKVCWDGAGKSTHERPDAHKRKKHSDVLCFLVAGRRIELRTS